MHRATHIRDTAIVAALLLLCGCSSMVSTRIVLEGTTVTHLTEFPHSGSLKLAHFPTGGFAMLRSTPDRDGSKLLEGYDDTLGLRWSRYFPYYYDGEPMLWMGYHSGSVVTAWQRWHSRDSITVWAHSYDPMTGSVKDSIRLGILGSRSYDEDRRVFSTRVIPSPDTTLFAAYTVDLLPVRGRSGFDSLRIHLSMADMQMHRRGVMTINVPILHIAEGKDAVYRIPGSAILDSLGRLYLPVAVGPTTVRIYRIDIEKGSSREIDITTARVYPDYDEDWLDDVMLDIDESGRLLVGASEQDRGSTGAFTVYRLDFERMVPDVTRRIEVESGILSRTEADGISDALQLREIRHAGVHGIVLFIEEAESYGTWDRSLNNQGLGFTIGAGPATSHRSAVVVSLDSNGATRWMTFLKRPPVLRPSGRVLSDLWVVDGDTLRYLARSLSAGTIDMRTGGMTEPRLLVSAVMHPDFANSRWFDARSGLVVLNTEGFNSIVTFKF